MEYNIKIRENSELPENEIIIETSRKNIDALKINEYKDLLNVFVAKDEDKNFVRIRLMDVSYFSSDGNNIYAICNRKKHVVKTRLYKLEANLHSSGFIRVNNSQLVNISKITKIISKHTNIMVLLFENDEPVFVSRRNIGRVKKELGVW